MEDVIVTVPDDLTGGAVVLSPDPGQVVQAETVQAATADMLATRLDDLSTTDIFLLMIWGVLFADFVLKLFLRVWGFSRW